MKIHGIKKAVSDWNGTSNISARLYYNTGTGDVWTAEFASLSSWIDYDDRAVIELASHDNLHFYKMSMAKIKELADQSLSA